MNDQCLSYLCGLSVFAGKLLYFFIPPKSGARYVKLPFLSMFLSNPLAAATVFFTIVITAGGCSWLGGGQANPEPPTVSAPESTIPFETREPGTYQADFVTISDGSESKTHFAQKDQRWRFDLFESGSPSRTVIGTEKIHHIDHAAKVYAEAPMGFPEPPQFVADLTESLLNERHHASYEKTGAEGELETYRVTVAGSNTPSTITYNTSIKMAVRHEIGGGFAWEMRQFTLDVDDALFQLPRGYRKIAWAEYKKLN